MKSITLLLFCFFMFNCAIAHDGSGNETRNKKTAIAAFNAMQAGDIDGVFRNYDKTIRFSNDGGAAWRAMALDSFKSASATNRKNWMESFPDDKHELIAAAADGDYVMLYTKSAGTWKKKLSIWEATGKPYKMNDVMVFRFNNDGKIIEQQSIMPQIALMDQVGEGGEFDINKAGYALLAQKKYDEAIEIFTLNVKLYPKSSNVYDSLGEAYMLAGNKKKAIENYERSVQMDPKNDNGVTMLKKLKG